ncbi:MAG: DNA methyltransferase [Candidatus Aenigmatarchaeota archaeon]
MASNIQLTLDLERQAQCIADIKPSTYKGIYAMHKYWSKKPPNIVAYFIEKYSRKGDIVLDPFSGYGVTGIEALRLGRKVVLIDLNPIATFISKVIVTPLNLNEVKNVFKLLQEKIKPQIDALYKIPCPHNKGHTAIVTHTIYQNNNIRKIWFECPNCKLGKGEIVPSEKDLTIYNHNITYDAIPFWYPQNIKLFDNSRINSRANMNITEFFTPRNLYAMSLLYNEIESISEPNIRNFFKFVFTGALPQMSNMVFVVRNRGKFNGKLCKSKEEVGSWVIGYWIPSEHFEINVWRCFENRYRKVMKGKMEAKKFLKGAVIVNSYNELVEGKGNIIISTMSATDLSFLPDRSIDYILTDPPHGDRIPYLELSALWASWLKLDLDYKNEIVVSDAKERNKDINDYKDLLYRSFKEMHRVLKDEKFVSIIFNNLDDEIWLSFLDIVLSSGFEIIEVSPMYYSAGSVVQDTRKGGLMSDFVFTCRKRNSPIKSFIFNTVIESKDNIKSYVKEAYYDLKSNNKSNSIKIYQILNIVIPRLVLEGKAFKISDLVNVSKEILSGSYK